MVPIRPAPPGIPTLHHAVALASVVSVDPATDSAVFRIRCGWQVHPKRKLTTRLWNVNLRRVSLSLDAHAATLTTWFRLAEARGWSGTMSLDRNGGNVLFDGPTTDVCHGVFP